MRKVMMIVFALMAIMMVAMPAFAQGGNAAAAGGSNWAVPLASGLGIGIAAGLAGLGQVLVGGAACDAMARHHPARPADDFALILGMAFIESLVLFTLVIIFAKVV